MYENKEFVKDAVSVENNGVIRWELSFFHCYTCLDSVQSHEYTPQKIHICRAGFGTDAFNISDRILGVPLITERDTYICFHMTRVPACSLLNTTLSQVC